MKSTELRFPWAAKLTGLLLILGPVYLLLSQTSVSMGNKVFWFSSVVGFGLLAFSYFSTQRANILGTLALTLIVGGGAQLWLTQPLWFPALRLRPDTMADLFMFGLIAVQALFALWAIHRTGGHRKILRLFQEFGPVRIFIFLALSAGFSVSLMGYLPRGFMASYAFHLVAGATLVGVNLLTLAAMLLQPAPMNNNRGFSPIIPAVIVLLASAALGWFSFERIPHVEDELVYLFQAKTFAGGSFFAPAPAEAARAGLEYYLLEIRDGRWFATTPPGWPGILTLGVLLGAPWIVNPILAAFSVLLAHAITRRLGGRRRADILVLLMCTSPWFLAASASLMPHNTAIFFTLLSWWLLLLAGKNTQQVAKFAGLAGLAMGWVFVTRQLEGVLIGTLTGLYIVANWENPKTLIRTVFYSLGAILSGGFYFFHNAVLTGNPLQAPLARYINEQWHVGANSYGFGPQIGPPGGWGDLDVAPGHSAFEGLLNTLHNLSALQLELFGWGIGSLALVYALVIWGKSDRKDWMMFAITVTIITAMFFYWFSGSFYIGPRYWFGLFFPVLYLSASGFVALSDRLQKLGVDRHSTATALFVTCLFGLLIFTPWRGVVKYFEYGNFSSEVRAVMESGAFSNALVIFDVDSNPASALMLNDPWLPADKPIFLMDMGAQSNAAARAHFAEREVVLFPN